jgi:adenylate kinase
LLEKLKHPIQVALLIEVDLDTLIQRMTGRRTCESCGQMYNIYTTPSKLDDRCDKCGGNLRHRADDNEETIGNRLRVYEGQTSPLIDYYRDQNLLRTVQGIGDISDIHKAVVKILTHLPVKSKKSPKVTATSKAAAATIGKRVKVKQSSAKKKPVKQKAPVKKKAAKKLPLKKKTAEKKPASKHPATRKKVVKKKVTKKAKPKKSSARPSKKK